MAVGRAHRVSLGAGASSVGRAHRIGVTAAAVSQQQGSYGRVHRMRLQVVNLNRAPVVSVNPPTLTVEGGDLIVLTGYSSDSDGTVVSQQWTLDGTIVGFSSILKMKAPVPALTDRVLTFVFSATDDDGLSASVSAKVTVRRSPIIRKNTGGSFTGMVMHLGPWDPAGGALTTRTVKLPTVALAFGGRFISEPVVVGVGTVSVVASADQAFTVIVETSNTAGSGYTEVGRGDSTYSGGRHVSSFSQPITAQYARVVIVCGPTDQTDLTADLSVTTGT